jgi:hypothetical protein
MKTSTPVAVHSTLYPIEKLLKIMKFIIINLNEFVQLPALILLCYFHPPPAASDGSQIRNHTVFC